MKKGIKEVLLAIFLGMIIPSAVIRIAEALVPPKKEIPQPTQPQATQMGGVTEATQICVLTDAGEITHMELEQYIAGVVLAEMPASFEPEALKAQAVVARTYALKRSVAWGKHPQNAVCTDSGCCQAYKDPETAEKASVEKVSAAVNATAGQVLTYNGALIEATYYSCSGGRTEDAQAVWGQDIPYLISVSSPGEEQATHYTDTVQFSIEDFCGRLNIEKPRSKNSWIKILEYTAGGGVAEAEIGEQLFTGMELRKLLSLRSTAFTMTVVGDTVTVTTKGFGHRVGMSQYGADAMALKGHSYEKILSHYYPGTNLEQWASD